MGGHQVTASDDFRILRAGLFQSTDVPLGNDEDVGRRLGIDVLKRVGVVIFESLPGRDLATNNAAKQAIAHDISSLEIAVRRAKTLHPKRSWGKRGETISVSRRNLQ